MLNQVDDTNGQERRMSFRIPLRILKVNTSKDGREIFFGYAKNLSSSGMHIQTSNPRDIGSKFDISFKLPKMKSNISCEAEVAWIQEYDPQTKTLPGMGIKFNTLPENDKKEIEDYIEKNS